MLGEMMSVLLGLPQSLWDAYALQNDPNCRKLSPSQRILISQGARQEAFNVALCKKRQYSQMPMSEVLVEHGLFVQDMPPTNWGTKIPFAIFEEPSNIYINREIVSNCQALLEQSDFAFLLGNHLVEEVLLAHELYHLCVSRGEAPYVRQKHARLWKLCGFEARREISALEEVGAMAFAEEFLGLSFCPFVLDVPLTYCHNAEQAMKIFDRILALRQKIEEESP